MEQMNVGMLAATIVTILIPYLGKASEELAKEAGKTMGGKIGVLYDALKARFKHHPAANDALDEAQAHPQDQDAQAALRLQIKKQIEADPVFGDSLRKIVREIGQDAPAMTFLTQVYGGEVGKIINIGNAENVQID